MNQNELMHYGIQGMKWGVRRYQNPDGTLTAAGRKRLAKKDANWIKRKEQRIVTKTFNKSEREMKKYAKELSKRSDSYLSNGKLSATYINNYNRKLAEVMNKNVGEIKSPSGKVVQFVAKRGELGVFTALADSGYDMDQLKNGIWADARVGYSKNKLDMIHCDANSNENYLVHFGVQNQKWGKRNGPPYPLKRDAKGHVIKTSKSLKDNAVSSAITSGKVSKLLNKEKQSVHLDGPKRDKNKSLLYGTQKDAQNLINKLSNTGSPVRDRKGEWTNKERVTNSTIIGELSNGKKSKYGMIVYSKTGSHIYPRKKDTK